MLTPHCALSPRMTPDLLAHYLRVTSRVMTVALLTTGLVACGGGTSEDTGSAGGSKGPENDEGDASGSFTFAEAIAGTNPKQIQLNWEFTGGSPDHYTLEVNPDGMSGFVQADLNGDGRIDNQDQISGSELSVTVTLPLHLLTNFNNGLYHINAHSDSGDIITTSDSIDLTSLVANQLVGYIKASNTDTRLREYFGNSISLAADGNTLAVGAHFESSDATGVNGDQTNNYALWAGSVYVFSRDTDTGNWSQQAYLKASNAETKDEFGISVTLADDGNTLAVGAKGEDSIATGVGGDATDNSADNSGAVYIFARHDNDWSQQAYVKASNTDRGDEFGGSVALAADGQTLAVGALGESSNATGVNGDANDNSADKAGAVYIFARHGNDWSQQAYVKASNTESSDAFGGNVALAADGNTLAVGAEREALNAGAVYTFIRNGTRWTQQAYVKASNTSPSDYFGRSVALSNDGNTLAVGAIGEDSNSTVIDGDQNNNDLWQSGAAYVYQRNGSTWVQEAYIKASNANEDDEFGTSISLSTDGNILAVGAYGEKSSATGINGDQENNTLRYAGAAYTFKRHDTTWSQHSYVKATNTDKQDMFGITVSLAGDGKTLAVGASDEGSNATGINGDQDDNTLNGSGAVYLY